MLVSPQKFFQILLFPCMSLHDIDDITHCSGCHDRWATLVQRSQSWKLRCGNGQVRQAGRGKDIRLQRQSRSNHGCRPSGTGKHRSQLQALIVPCSLCLVHKIPLSVCLRSEKKALSLFLAASLELCTNPDLQQEISADYFQTFPPTTSA
jgi:hypothetical protein